MIGRMYFLNMEAEGLNTVDNNSPLSSSAEKKAARQSCSVTCGPYIHLEEGKGNDDKSAGLRTFNHETS